MQLLCLERWEAVLLCKKESRMSHLQLPATRTMVRETTIVIWVFEEALRGKKIFLWMTPLPSYKQFENKKFSVKKLAVPVFLQFVYRGGRKGCSWKATSCQCKQEIHWTGMGICFYRKSTALKKKKEKKLVFWDGGNLTPPWVIIICVL